MNKRARESKYHESSLWHSLNSVMRGIVNSSCLL